MAWLKNLPVSRKFTVAFGIVCGLCIVLGTYTFIAFRSIAIKSTDVSASSLPALIDIGDIREGVNMERREDLELMLCQTEPCRADHTAKRQKAIAEYQDALKTMASLVLAQDRDQYARFAASIKVYQDASDRGVGLLSAGKPGDALDLLSSDVMASSLAEALGAADKGFNIHAEIGTLNAEGATQSSHRATWVSTCATLLIMVLCALTGLILTRLIAPPLEAATAALERVAEKDLTVSVEESGTDEIGRLSAALNTSVASMRSVLQAVAQGAETLSAATTEISARSVQTAGNAHTQSSKTNQIAAAAQEMTATIGEISHNAESAAGSSRQSAQTADQGGAYTSSITAGSSPRGPWPRPWHCGADRRSRMPGTSPSRSPAALRSCGWTRRSPSSRRSSTRAGPPPASASLRRWSRNTRCTRSSPGC